MKLLSFLREGQASRGCVVGQGLVDIGARSAGQFPDLKTFIAAGMPGEIRGPAETLAEVELAPVIPNPDKVVLAAINYWENGSDPDKAPAYPVLFLRLPSSPWCPFDRAAILKDRSSGQVWRKCGVAGFAWRQHQSQVFS